MLHQSGLAPLFFLEIRGLKTGGAADVVRAVAQRVTDGRGFKLSSVSPGDSAGLDLKEEADDLLADSMKELTALQERLYAQDKFSVLLIFQAMDAAGKDSTIKHVMSGVNPQG